MPHGLVWNCPVLQGIRLCAEYDQAGLNLRLAAMHSPLLIMAKPMPLQAFAPGPGDLPPLEALSPLQAFAPMQSPSAACALVEMVMPARNRVAAAVGDGGAGLGSNLHDRSSGWGFANVHRPLGGIHGRQTRDAAGYWTETDTTPAPIMPSARAALTDTSMILPRINGPRSLTRHWIERPDRVVTVTTLPIGLVR